MKIYGVYNANSGLVGELKYVLGKCLGTTRCDFCDITHSFFSQKKEWRAMKEKFQVPIYQLHINEQNEKLKNFTDGKTPCVVLEKDKKLFLLMDKDALSECGGNVWRFERRLAKTIKDFI